MTDRFKGELAETELVESPPAKIKAGTATIAGLGVTAAALVPVVVDFLKDGSVSPAVKLALIHVAGAVAIAVILIRGAQAVAVEISRGRGARALAERSTHELEEVDALFGVSDEILDRLQKLEKLAAVAEKRSHEAMDVAKFAFKSAGEVRDRGEDDEGPRNDYDDDDDALIVTDHEDHAEVIVAGGDSDDAVDLHDRHDVPEEALR